MSHLTDERMTTLAFDLAEPTDHEVAHLQTCAACHRTYDELLALAGELTVAARSQPDAEAMQRYYQLADQVQVQAGGLKTLLREVMAALTWDSRQQVAMQGVRSVAATEYRLLYSADVAEVELMVEIDGARRHIEGELIPLVGGELAPALLQLQRLDDPSPTLPGVGIETETETGEGGRFRFQDLQPGRYRLNVATSIMPTVTDIEIAIDGLDIT